MTVKPEWPRILYHKHMAPGGWRVESEAERATLGKGWTDEPPALGPATPAPVVIGGARPLEDMSAEELRAIAKDRGAKVHHKAGKEKLIDAIKGVQA